MNTEENIIKTVFSLSRSHNWPEERIIRFFKKNVTSLENLLFIYEKVRVKRFTYISYQYLVDNRRGRSIILSEDEMKRFGWSIILNPNLNYSYNNIKTLINLINKNFDSCRNYVPRKGYLSSVLSKKMNLSIGDFRRKFSNNNSLENLLSMKLYDHIDFNKISPSAKRKYRLILSRIFPDEYKEYMNNGIHLDRIKYDHDLVAYNRRTNHVINKPTKSIIPNKITDIVIVDDIGALANKNLFNIAKYTTLYDLYTSIIEIGGASVVHSNPDIFAKDTLYIGLNAPASNEVMYWNPMSYYLHIDKNNIFGFNPKYINFALNMISGTSP